MKIKEKTTFKIPEKIGFGDVFLCKNEIWGFESFVLLSHVDNNKVGLINLESGNREIGLIKVDDNCLVSLISSNLDMNQFELMLIDRDLRHIKLTKVKANLEVE